jgi:LysM repeat protein
MNDDPAAPTVIFCEGGTMKFYSALGRGDMAVSREQIGASVSLAVATGTNVIVAEGAGMSLSATPGGQLVMSAPHSNGYQMYTFSMIASACGPLPTASQPTTPSTTVITPSTVPSTATTPNTAASGTVHVVQRGENLFRIALRYGVDMNALAAANGIADPTRIFPGQELVIP